MQELIDLQQQVYEANKAKGFWDDLQNRNKGEAVALINSELYEALEGHRKGRDANLNLMSLYDDVSSDEIYEQVSLQLEHLEPTKFHEFMDDYIKDTWQDELADAVIRVLDYTGGFSYKLIDGSASVGQKLPDNFGEAILVINMRVNGVYTAINQNYGETGWSYVLLEIQQLAGKYLYQHVIWKLKYNALRPYKHGKKY